jgi:alkaline phosphatase
MKNLPYRFVACLLLLLAPSTYSFATKTCPNRNVILYIGDGFGMTARTTARMAMGQGTIGKRTSSDAGFQILELDRLRYVATATTHSKNSWTTDSAPGATAFSCGRKVQNEAIAFDLDSLTALETILEQAKKNGYAVGLVTTTRVTHATPAAFASHIWNRDIEEVIAAQYLSSTQSEYEEVFRSSGSYDSLRHWKLPRPKTGVTLDVLLGGGTMEFLPAGRNDTVRVSGQVVAILRGRRRDGRDLLATAKARGYLHVNSREELFAIQKSEIRPTESTRLLGLFAESHCDVEQERQRSSTWQPSLSEMTRAAIDFLRRKSRKGFFLMVEGGRIDHIAHENAGSLVFGDSITVEVDRPAMRMTQVPSNRPTNDDRAVYGSDYLIKEVLEYDHAVAEGLKLLRLPRRHEETLIVAVSDHETGGVTATGLHDSTTNRYRPIRTYALPPSQHGENSLTPVPTGVSAGPAWFPQYSLRNGVWPEARSDGQGRIVISYGSNPYTNGNGPLPKAKDYSPGNHTPQDVIVGADDNLGGEYARRITGRGLIDNTDITPIVASFLRLKYPLRAFR